MHLDIYCIRMYKDSLMKVGPYPIESNSTAFAPTPGLFVVCSRRACAFSTGFSAAWLCRGNLCLGHGWHRQEDTDKSKPKGCYYLSLPSVPVLA